MKKGIAKISKNKIEPFNNQCDNFFYIDELAEHLGKSISVVRKWITESNVKRYRHSSGKIVYDYLDVNKKQQEFSAYKLDHLTIECVSIILKENVPEAKKWIKKHRVKTYYDYIKGIKYYKEEDVHKRQSDRLKPFKLMDTISRQHHVRWLKNIIDIKLIEGELGLRFSLLHTSSYYKNDYFQVNFSLEHVISWHIIRESYEITKQRYFHTKPYDNIWMGEVKNSSYLKTITKIGHTFDKNPKVLLFITEDKCIEIITTELPKITYKSTDGKIHRFNG